jgi:DNA-directed RNA polymerase subunit RPC12/RpoP
MENSSGKSHCSVKKMPVPAFMTCLKCGYDVELWSDEEETTCPVCSRRVFRGETTVR